MRGLLIKALRTVGVALKAVNGNHGVDVTRGAEMIGAGVARINQLPFGLPLRLNMAIDAVDKAMLLGAHALMHGFIALVQNKVHVATAHDLGRLHALLALSLRDGRQQRIVLVLVPFSGQHRSGKKSATSAQQKSAETPQPVQQPSDQ